MYIITYIIFISLFVAGCFLMAFVWAVKDGQYDDEVTPSMRILIDDDMITPAGAINEKTNIKDANTNF